MEIEYKKTKRKFEILSDTIHQLLTLQKNAILFNDKLSALGIELIGKSFEISGSYALLHVVLDLAGIPDDTFTELLKIYPEKDASEIFELSRKTEDSYCRDGIVRECIDLLIEKNDIHGCIRLIADQIKD